MINNRLVPVKTSKDLPFTVSTIYKLHHLKSYPSIILKIGGRLYWDWGAWDDECEKVRETQVKEAKRLAIV